jgi:hypothetical protein
LIGNKVREFVIFSARENVIAFLVGLELFGENFSTAQMSLRAAALGFWRRSNLLLNRSIP